MAQWNVSSPTRSKYQPSSSRSSMSSVLDEVPRLRIDGNQIHHPVNSRVLCLDEVYGFHRFAHRRERSELDDTICSFCLDHIRDRRRYAS